MQSSLFQTLKENAKFVNVKDDNDGPSAGEAQCVSQQEALVACMSSIREHNEKDSSNTAEKRNTACLAPAVASWTDCCVKANEEI